MKPHLFALLTAIAWEWVAILKKGLHLGNLSPEMGIIFGGEPLTFKTVAGMALTVGGIVLLTIG